MLHVHTSAEHLPFRLSTQHVAVGRLGRIYPALEQCTGRVVAVESVPLSSRASTEHDCHALLGLVERALLVELEATRGHDNLICYDTLHFVATPGRPHLYLSASGSGGAPALLKDFGRLQPLVVRRYMRGIARALSALHERGVEAGGITSSSVLISSDGTARVAAFFPSTRALRVLLDSALAYVMVEMLTGMRVRGRQLERERLLSLVVSETAVVRDFVLELLRSSSLRAVAAHPYIAQSSAHSHHSALLGDRSPECDSDEQRAVAGLVEQELAKCRELRRGHVGEIRAWLAQFEKRHERKPSAAERPRTVAALQHRCRALSQRMREIEAHLAAQGDDDDEQLKHDARLEDQRALGQWTSPPRHLDSTVGVLPPIDIATRTGGALSDDAQRRSPAQHAFLKRLEAPVAPPTDAVASDGLPDRRAGASHCAEIVTERVNGHHIIHQRREVMQVINTIATADSSNSDGATAAHHYQ
ncbi:hypothetical protein PybrP1_011570 [[Pythium] brassicae (nom. inval.)]|nr:hypothetical protein PybrP1_011570 [[Pythium] brassicae (nom. inval.)]